MTKTNPQDFDLFGDAIPAAAKSDAPKADGKPKQAEPATVEVQPETAEVATANVANADVGEANNSVVPDKRYFTISEAAELCGAKPHVLRYWESEFKQLSPVKRAGNRRYYQRQDIFLIRQIRELLHEQGFTIAGAKQKLNGENSKEEISAHKQALREVRQELELLLKSIKR